MFGCRGGWLLATLALLAAGCFVQVADDDGGGGGDPSGSGGDVQGGPCDQVACSEEGYCQDGECFCNPYFVGNPYALYGCQPSMTIGSCVTTCGLNAHCEEQACVCADGFVAVCSTGDCIPQTQLCDGVDDCVNAADESPEVCTVAEVQQWALSDGCDDGVDVGWRLWAQDRGWVWPSPDSVFVTQVPFEVSYQSIECVQGETICLGAVAGELSWGVGVDGLLACDDCCFPCAEGVVNFGELGCG